MKLSILIVNWNTKELLTECLRSIFANPPEFEFEVIVVDNHSADGSVDALRQEFGADRRVGIIAADDNLGFAKATNRAYEKSKGEFILLLNPDTTVWPKTLQTLVEYLARNREVGIVGPKILNTDGSVQASVRQLPRLWPSVLVFSGLHRLWRPRRYLMDDFDYDQQAVVDQVMGAALLTRRSIINDLGFLDEKFWLWYEEVDFCKRVRHHGFAVMYLPQAAVTHHQGESFAQLTVWQRKRTVARSLIYYFQKNGRPGEVWVLRLVALFVLAAAGLLSFWQMIFKRRSAPHV